MDPFVSAAWLAARTGHVRIADVRWYLDGRPGRAAYEKGHIPGAVFIDLERWLAAPAIPGGGRHPLPVPEIFADGMSRAGIGDAATVIAYDDAGGVIAARLVWMLRVLGHQAAVLDGGIDSWEGELSRQVVEPSRATFTPAPWPGDRLATIEEACSPKHLVIDARDADRYRGESEPIDPRAGHIPGAHSLPCRGNLGPERRMLPIPELRRRFELIGVVQAEGVISYCGSGVTACHNLLVLEHAGFGIGRLYPGSWSEYSRREDLPVATGDLAQARPRSS